MLNRITPHVVQSLAMVTIGDCSTGFTSTGAMTGSIIDTLALGRDFRLATPFVLGEVLGTTFLNKLVTVAVKLQHGSSSGGGDMADFSTQFIPSAQSWFSSAMTTVFNTWSTANYRLSGPTVSYDVSPAKRFIRPVATIILGGNTTSTASVPVTAYGGVVFNEADQGPISLLSRTVDINTTFPTSSTSTST